MPGRGESAPLTHTYLGKARTPKRSTPWHTDTVSDGNDCRLRVLVSGAGVAGSSVAYWLKRHGFEPTVVEQAPGLRRGGQAVDFRGPAMTVLERMGILDRVEAHDTEVGDCTIVDGDGVPFAVMPAVVYAGELEVLVDKLIEILYDLAANSGVEYRFGDYATALVSDDDGVTVSFEHAAAQRFDLVIGADGTHSGIRTLVFGPEGDFTRFLGCYAGFFEIDNYLGLDHEGKGTGDGERAALNVFSVDHNARARVGVQFKSEYPLAYDLHDPRAHKRLLIDHTRHLGWETRTLLEKLHSADALYFDAMTQIRMPSWSRGRVVLVGDAGYCSSPASGRGTSQALIGAYVLAGELAAAHGEHTAAFAAYEAALREYVDGNQELGAEYSENAFTRPTQEGIDAIAAAAREPETLGDGELTLNHYPPPSSS